jgi:16S rRNA (guanine527-N7)-methyltransferase
MSFHKKTPVSESSKPEVGSLKDTSGEKYKKWFPLLSEETHKKVLIYHEELLKFNSAINLISAATISKADSLHFADSILACQIVMPGLVPDQDIYDFGSGNGFPGLVMACLYPKANLILVERDGRKAEFLKHMISIMGLPNAKVLVKSVEELPESSCYNVVTRGFAALHKCMMLARKPLAKGGRIFHLKGENFSSELAAVPSQLFSHWSATLAGNYSLPDSNSVETVVLTEKLT